MQSVQWRGFMNVFAQYRPVLQVLAILEEYYVNGDIQDAATTLQASSLCLLIFLEKLFALQLLAAS